MDTIHTDTDDVGSRADIIFREMLQDIYAGRLQQDETINEVELSKRFGVSRGPVREAIRRLQGIGLVTRTPFVKARVITLSVSAMLELFEIRMALEGMACKLATERMSDEGLDELEAHLHADRIAEQGTLPSSLPKFDFHARIVQGSGNARLVESLSNDNYNLLRLYRTSTSAIQARKQDAYDEHAQIVMAMKSRNSVLAESLMRSHIQRASQHMKQQLNDKD